MDTETITVFHVRTTDGCTRYLLHRPSERYCTVLGTAVVTLPKGVSAWPIGGFPFLQRGREYTHVLGYGGGRVFANFGGEEVTICAEF